MFSSRLRSGTGHNRLARALDARRKAGLPIVDLTLSNPTRAGLAYPPALLKSLGHQRGLCYEPTPLGLPEARRAVADDYARRGATIPPEHIVLTASTSEGYSLLFKLLCDPGDVVLTPRPSYPLVEHLTDLDAVSAEPYSLEFHGAWSIDVEGMRQTVAEASTAGRKVRAIVVISPNNPTGSVVKRHEAEAIASLAREHDLSLIVDEVFADYPLEKGSGCIFPPCEALMFRLGGLSKTVGLPQLKLGWIGVSGPTTLVREAMNRLEIICDAYLSVSTPVQATAAELLREGAAVRAQIHQRVRGNLDRLKSIAAAHRESSLLSPEAGWYAVIQVPAIGSEEAMIVGLLERTGILVHPGYFFDFEREAFLVISLLPEPKIFQPAVEQLLGEIGGQ
jgi:aspartate/methionine/tyrosine aminotransferase